MKKLLILILLPLFARSQNKLPSYPTVLKEFFKNYSYTPEEETDGITFAKKKTGWYVQVVNRITDEEKKEQIFWSVNTHCFNQLDDLDLPLSVDEAEDEVQNYL